MDRAIPGPKTWNPFAFLHAMFDAAGWLNTMEQAYGDTFLLRSTFGPIVFTGNPEAVRVLFTEDPDIFEPFQPDASAPFLGETSLVLVAGARHRRDRKLLSPPFNGARMRAYGALMGASADRMIASWTKGRPFRMLDATQVLSLDVILQAVFGLGDEDGRTPKVREAVIEFIGAISPWFIFLPSIRRDFMGFGPWARFQRASAKLDALLYEVIAARRSKDEPREDIMRLMMNARYEDGGAMSDKDLRDELLTLLFAGHETTAIALAWALYWLHRSPDELERVRGEIAALGPNPEPDALAALPYLDAVCQETLRIHPIVIDIPRMLRRSVEVLGYTVPAGTALSASVILVHNRPDLYPEPHRFRPSRFLERKFTPFEFLPFGGGARRCIGSSFALYEMKIVLARLVSGHRLRLASNTPPRAVRRGLTMGPKGGIPMIYDGPR